MSNHLIAKELLNQILREQRFAVLATLNNQQPYTNLVAFAVSDNLEHILFATNRDTLKYHNIVSNNKIALLIDNRSNNQSDFTRALAVTVIGTAIELAGKKRGELVRSYLNKHPSLEEFLNKPDTAVISVLVTDFILARFDSTERIQMNGNKLTKIN
jgi:nitroimidazol reductase NimA-like FMN-containing flavoprotein (pyridoxamine 5'-phosphate oxidase superfamily)